MKMKTCPYCGIELKEMITPTLYRCHFCEMAVIPSEEGKRDPKIIRRANLNMEDMYKAPGQLINYHTYDLLIILKSLREERRSAFEQLQLFKEVDDAAFAENYEDVTRRVWAVENILNERLGYIPKMITNKIVGYFLDCVEQSKDKKAMVFSK
jgi:hypothetical protein